jgi:acyl carrier protein
VAERRDVAGAVVVRPHPTSDAAQDLVRRWTAGEEIDWRAFYPAGRPTPLSMLPTYPFAKKRCWIDAVATEAVPPAALAPPVAQEPPESLLRPEPVVAGTPAIPPAPAIEPARPVGLADTMQRIRRIIEAFLELSTDDELDEFASFADMGLTSLAIVEFVDEINRQFDLALPETTAFDYPTLPELAKHVAALGAIRSADAPADRPARPVHATEPV